MQNRPAKTRTELKRRKGRLRTAKVKALPPPIPATVIDLWPKRQAHASPAPRQS